jgi:hypothetical protein
MTMENSGHEEMNSVADKGQPPAAAVRNPSRRRFTRVGVGASAVVMTLASRSVLANMACTAPSGFHSANLSHGGPGDSAIRCDGLSYQEWMTAEDWNPPKDSMFKQVLGVMPRHDLMAGTSVVAETFVRGKAQAAGQDKDNGSDKDKDKDKDKHKGSDDLKLKDATLHQALCGDKTPLVVKHLVAALLNVNSGRSTYPTADNIQDIFNEWNTHNCYEVTAGVKWSTAEIIEYLSYTQTRGMPTFPATRVKRS